MVEEPQEQEQEEEEQYKGNVLFNVDTHLLFVVFALTDLARVVCFEGLEQLVASFAVLAVTVVVVVDDVPAMHARVVAN